VEGGGEEGADVSTHKNTYTRDSGLKNVFGAAISIEFDFIDAGGRVLHQICGLSPLSTGQVHHVKHKQKRRKQKQQKCNKHKEKVDTQVFLCI
jgi:hypothetical protein